MKNSKYILHTLWISLIGIAIWQLSNFAYKPGVSVKSNFTFPVSSSLKLSSSSPTLLVFLHPKCNCSKATLTELSELMPSMPKAKVIAIFIVPKGRDIAWAKNDLWSEAEKIKGLKLVTDPGGVESKLFHASTSGQSFLFDKNKLLVFSGGLTSARGHTGGSSGQEYIKQWFKKPYYQQYFDNVFGCGLWGERK